MYKAPYFALPGASRVSVNLQSPRDTLAVIDRHLKARTGFSLATLNLDHLVKLHLSQPFREAYARTTYVTADGIPIVWLSRMQGLPVELVTGADLVEPLCALAARRGVPVALFGASPETLERAAARLEARHDGLRIVFRVAPEQGFDPAGDEAGAHGRAIADSGAGLCFVALGAPKQEMFAGRVAALAPRCGFVGIGAGLDFLAATQHRAPGFMRRFALEWLWRLMRSPGRLALRYGACAALLPFLVLESLVLRRHPPDAPRSAPRPAPAETLRAQPMLVKNGDPISPHAERPARRRESA